MLKLKSYILLITMKVRVKAMALSLYPGKPQLLLQTLRRNKDVRVTS